MTSIVQAGDSGLATEGTVAVFDMTRVHRV